MILAMILASAAGLLALAALALPICRAPRRNFGSDQHE
jgi:hypothetical protein